MTTTFCDRPAPVAPAAGWRRTPMARASAWAWAGLACAGLLACGGGGGGSSDNNNAGNASAPPTTGSPTATLSASAQTASDLAASARSGAIALDKVGGFNAALPLGVQVAAPLGVTSTQTNNCSGGGSTSTTLNEASPPNTSAGDSAHVRLNNCVEAGVALNGTVDVGISRFVSKSNFAFSFTTSGLTATQGGITRGPYAFTGQYDFNPSGNHFSYTVDGLTVLGPPTLSRDGSVVTVSNAITRSALGNGFVELTFAGWVFDRDSGRGTGGSVTVSAATGDSATITVASDGYRVTLRIAGITTTYTVGF